MLTKGTERELIEAMLDQNREALIETVRGLSEADARRRLVTSLTTPISLIKHAAAAERIWFQRFWAGLDESECDGYARQQYHFHQRRAHSRGRCVVGRYDG